MTEISRTCDGILRMLETIQDAHPMHRDELLRHTINRIRNLRDLEENEK